MVTMDDSLDESSGCLLLEKLAVVVNIDVDVLKK